MVKEEFGALGQTKKLGRFRVSHPRFRLLIYSVVITRREP